MKKTFILTVLILLAVFLVGVASAKTLVAGKIYNSDYTDTIADASVDVTCNNFTQYVTSLSDGAYAVTFNETGVNGCNNGSEVSVYAYKGDLYGSKTGIVHDNVVGYWDIAIINVPLVPEFGLVVGMVTILSATVIFFIIRRK